MSWGGKKDPLVDVVEEGEVMVFCPAVEFTPEVLGDVCGLRGVVVDVAKG